MDDSRIVELYFKRSETAVEESRSKYGKYCNIIADNILRSAEDAEECVNDTWLRAWNSIPPAKPKKLAVFLGRITRNLAIDRYRKRTAEKRGGGETEMCLEELAECVGGEDRIIEGLPLRDLLNRFLGELLPREREIFMLRYWYTFSVKEVAERMKLNEAAVKMSLYRSRCSLQVFLADEDYDI
ncbi:MAG: RNA polymerase sigma factor [Bacteroides sp.]|nr:RNA polymerase sigma factor [Bacteroides sp.]